MPTVLAVDDTPANLELLHGILGERFRVKVATRGEKALELAAKSPQPDVILLDIMMPGMSGYEVCERLKADPATAGIPVIFITAKTQAEDEQLGLELGAVDYITKPFNGESVRARVSTHLAGHVRTRSLERENEALRVRAEGGFRDLSGRALAELVAAGEGESVEFKSTLRWNLHADRADKDIENGCLKTVAGYLNTDGGTLIVGVDDNGAAVGLARDAFRSEDKLMLHWTNLVTSYLGAEFVRFMRSALHDLDGQRVLVVQVLASAAPVFFERDNHEAFYVRVANSTHALSPSKTLAYVQERFAADGTGNSDFRPGGPRPGAAGPDLHSLADWIRELQDRHVFRTGIIYLVLGWAFTEMSTTVAATLEAPGWVERAIVLLFIAGFPVMVVLAWLYDLRVVRTVDAGTPPRARRWWMFGGVIVAISVASAMYLSLG